MKIEIDLKDLLNQSGFSGALAECIAQQMNWQLLKEEWETPFMAEFRAKLEAEVKKTAQEWLDENKGTIEYDVEKILKGFTKSQIIDILRGKS